MGDVEDRGRGERRGREIEGDDGEATTLREGRERAKNTGLSSS